jgi:hypothetical protein
VFAWREDRTVSQSLTLQYEKMLFILEPTPITSTLRRKKVTVADYPDGKLKILHKGVELPYRLFDKLQHVSQAAIVDNKRLGTVLAHIRQRQQLSPKMRRKRTPVRRDQGPGMFKVG